MKTIRLKLDSKIIPVLSMYSCEHCGRCCRTERVTVSPLDRRLNRGLSRAIESKVISGYATLKLPCIFITDSNMCSCYDLRPYSCKRYPFSEKYPGYVTISVCPYGSKIINDLMEFCKIRGIPTESIEGKESIEKLDSMYQNLGVGQEESFEAVSVPVLVFNEFCDWVGMQRMGVTSSPA